MTPFIISVFLFDIVFKTVTYSDINLQNYAGAMAGEGLRYRGDEGQSYLALYTLVNGVYQEHATAQLYGESVDLEAEEEDDGKKKKKRTAGGSDSEVTDKGTCSFKFCGGDGRRRLELNPYE